MLTDEKLSKSALSIMQELYGQMVIDMSLVNGGKPGGGSEDFASNIDLTDAINRFLRNLPIEQRRVFIKRYWYMSSITDTATSFGMSESKVTSILFRVRNKLKEHLTKEGFDL